ncbi:hypothetical protein L1049_008021 [Liquidambar formosana]|uniref:Exostosin GT47 domain-containing protein n=1 Tax=Liquidambar formosana TaxID=63359 RepID=A0AAP0S313_LIQFO
MGDVNKRLSSSSASLKLLLFMVPLIVVIGCVALLGPESSNWVFISHYPWAWSSTTSTAVPPPTSSATNSTIHIEKLVASTKDGEEGHVGLRSRVVGSVHNNREEALSDDSVLNRSASPPLAVQPIQSEQSNGNEEESLSIAMSGTPTAMVPTYESQAVPMEARVPREYSKLEKLEAGLRRARSAIQQAKYGNQSQDPDYVPLGPMYWNANAFHRSYLEMEKQFKVFIYEEGEPPLFHNGPCKSIYSTEGNFIHGLEMDNQFRTKDPDKAHVYFLPFSVSMMVQFVYVRNSHDFSPIRQTVIDYVNVVAGKYPYWNRSLAADHFMLSCHDWGPETSFSVPYLHKNSIRVLCNANTSEGFDPSKDASFPEINLQTGGTRGLLGGPSPSRRSVLAFFAGGVHGPIRPVLLEHWENKDEDIKVHQYLPRGVSYYDMMRKSKYCICPSGYEVASPRVVEAIYTGCVPVLISDHYVPPFSDVLNWKSFSVEVPVKDIPNLKRILTSISTSQYIRMQRRVAQIRKHFEVNSPPKRFDVHHMILHSVWLRRLNVRVHG